MRPARGPRRVLWVVVVTICACGTGEGWTPPATSPAKWAMSTMRMAPECVGDLAHAGEVEEARISAAAADDDFGILADGDLLELVVVDGFGIFADAVGDDAIELAGEIELVAVGEVAAHGEVEAEDGVAGLEDGGVGGGVGLGAGVGLDVGVFGAKDLFGAVAGQVLDHVGVLAAAVVAASRIALSIFVGEDGARGFEDGAADEVFRGDHLEAFVLAADFGIDGGGDFGIFEGEGLGHAVGHGEIVAKREKRKTSKRRVHYEREAISEKRLARNY